MFKPAFIRHRGQEILRLDFVGLAHAELLAGFDAAGRLVRAQPLGSLRVHTVLRSRFNAESAEALKRYDHANRPYVRASAVVGTNFWKVIVTSLQLRGREDLVLFEDELSALDWLAGTGGIDRADLAPRGNSKAPTRDVNMG